ncbi:hypothetical protein NFI96_003500 [Prochilodus magdalenae]|nr:hypothetical protein NFI96_003500 [Prochilodus magdalenae]
MFKLHGMDYHRAPSGTSTAPYRDVWRVGLANTAARRHTERQTSAQCLCCSATCLACRCCPRSKNSIVTRVIYAFIMLIGTIIACIMLSPGVEQQLKRIPGFCEGGAGSSIPGIQARVHCETFVGYKAVYRVCFGMSMCFLAFSLIMINVRNSRDPRAALHNSFWFFKIAFIVGVTVGAFYIPEGPFTRSKREKSTGLFF